MVQVNGFVLKTICLKKFVLKNIFLKKFVLKYICLEWICLKIHLVYNTFVLKTLFPIEMIKMIEFLKH